MHPTMVFRGQGNVTQEEQDAYPDGLVVLFQEKAWVDRPLAMEWAEDVMKPFMQAERDSGVCGECDRYLMPKGEKFSF